MADSGDPLENFVDGLDKDLPFPDLEILWGPYWGIIQN